MSRSRGAIWLTSRSPMNTEPDVIDSRPANAPPHIVVGDPKLRAFFQRLVDVMHSTGSGSATRVARALLLANPPSIDRGEITDKGSINQRAVLTHRDADVVRMYIGTDRDVIRPVTH